MTKAPKNPKVLPAAFPNLLINGANGIAVGMATNIPPHNPTEIIDATLAMIANPGIGLDELMPIVPGPDFPTGGIILGRAGIRQAFETGRGSVILRARTEFEEIRKDRTAIIVTEIPYQVNKATLMERIADLVRNKQVEGISDMRDESDRDGMRMVVELKRDATPDVVLNQLFRFTQLQTSFGVNMLALDNGRPRQMGIREALTCFITFREDVILRRARHDLARARDRGHLLVGLAIAVANIDEVIRLIRAAPDAASAPGRPHGPRLAGRGRAASAGADRGSRQYRRRHQPCAADRSAGPRHSRSAPAAPHRPRTRTRSRRNSPKSPRRSRICSTSSPPARAGSRSCAMSWPPCVRKSARRA